MLYTHAYYTPYTHYIQGLHEQYDSTIKGLETACVERITSSLTNSDGRLIHPTHDDIDRCKLEDVKKAVTRIMTPEAVEVSGWVVRIIMTVLLY